MNKMQVKFKKMHPDAKMPTYATDGSLGLDVYACVDHKIIVHCGETILVPLGFSMSAPFAYAPLLIPRSGLGHKSGIVLGNLVGLVDSDYTGQVFASIWNRNQSSTLDGYVINPRDKIAQMIIVPVPRIEIVEVEELSKTVRGSGGFGSTGL